MTLLVLAFLLAVTANNPAAAEVNGQEPYKWTRPLPNKPCPGTSNTYCHWSSPVLARIDGDNFLDIVVATNNGHVVAIRHDNTLLWDRDVAPYFGMAPGTQEIHSSPAVADIDNDNLPEIVVGAGTTYGNVCTHGGVIVLDHNGNVQSGWPYLTVDESVPPAGCRDSVFATPALGDLDNDGDLEIAVGSFDKRIYVWNHNGSLVYQFPPDSFHLLRFPGWDDLVGRVADTIWSSPIMADVNGDGYLDVITGTDEGNYDARYGGNSGGWTCPFAAPPGIPPGYCGGSLYALDRFGNILPGFPRYIHETIQSTPAAADIDQDGNAEIFVGTGGFYYNNSPDRPTFGFRVFGFDGSGADLPGWSGGKVVGGVVPASPSIGDIAGDSQPEIVVAAMDKRLYAWHANGQPVAGFPMTPRDQFGNTLASFNVGASFVLGDYDGDNKMEIIFNQAWVVTIVDGNGQQLTTNNFPSDPRPLYFTDGTLLNTPAVGDIDNDGKLELVVSSSNLYTWDLNNSSNKADWPMFKQNAARTGAAPQPPRLETSPDGSLTVLHQDGSSSTGQGVLVVHNTGGAPFNWTATAAQGITLTPASGSTGPGQSATVTVRISIDNRPQGTYQVGSITVTALVGGQPAQNSPTTLPVTLIIGDITNIFLPLIQ
ncbi:MAG: FG-GAP-like repeat-containing protein [Chloroflexi bacterium]|nr:FG-GAP-like repeat-containing protein [Chloroflexota bacterium]MCI0576588.1 FG-GAP-like repeat-containing protein [Chloroflexota bacterium]MCI0647386.1 FG-GAP-like repeat-containing protein [Chloroflexota bacterium]MCI0728276.1 FG-GAP-like repeat-containing protein [Chloroflexota bacterium]